MVQQISYIGSEGLFLFSDRITSDNVDSFNGIMEDFGGRIVIFSPFFEILDWTQDKLIYERFIICESF